MTLHQSITHSNPTPCSSWLHHSMPQPSGGSTPSQPVVAREHLWLPVEAVPSHPLPAWGETFLLCTVSLLQHSPQWSLLRVAFLLFAAFHRGLNGINWLYRLCLWHLEQLKGSRDVSEREREREAGMSDWRELGMGDMWRGWGVGGGALRGLCTLAAESVPESCPVTYSGYELRALLPKGWNCNTRWSAPGH